MPMSVREVTANANVKDDSNKVAFEYGPFVYCAEEADNKQIDQISIPGNLILQKERKILLSDRVNMLKGTAGGNELTLIPYYMWSNRGAGKMKVWFPKGN